MKTHRLCRRLAAVPIVIAALVAVGCGGSDDTSTSTGSTGGASATTVAKESFTIGFSAPILQNPTIQAMVQGMAYEAQQAGSKIIVKDARLQGNQQISDLDDLTNQGVDALIVWATTDPKTLAPALRRAADAGIPIFSIDGSGFPDEITMFQQPSKQMGVDAAKAMADIVGSGEIGVIGGVPAPSIIERVEAFRSTVGNEFPQLKIVAEQDNLKDVAAGAEPLVGGMLTKYPQLKGVYTYNDPSAIGASAAARSEGRDDLVIIGNNADPQGVAAVEDGRITATIDVKPVELGSKAMQTIVGYLDGSEPNPPKVVTVEPEIVTKANVGEFVAWEERTPQPDYGKVCSGCTQ